MQTRLQVTGAVSGRRRQKKNPGAAGSLMRAPDTIVAARLRRLALSAARNGNGFSALFAGPSGTGKTIAASLAKSLGRRLYRVDLSDTAEKYIGETEKNLSHAFVAAQKRKAVLFFDEADAIFGKRTGVADSHDSYANLEVSHLLARIARHRGVVILSANPRDEIDPAIIRRFHAVVRIPPARE